MLTEQELEQVERTISDVEQRTSGEIRVHIDSFCKIDPYQRGVDIFHELRMYETQERNGVLIYIDFTHRKFAIVGDEGIHKKVGDEFWENAKAELLNEFKNSNFSIGVCNSVMVLGEKLAEYFPNSDSDLNELSNKVTTG